MSTEGPTMGNEPTPVSTVTPPRPAPPVRAPRLSARVATILVSMLLALLVAEVALRLLVPPRTHHYVWLPGTYHTFKPRHDLLPDYTPETRFSINSAGLRGPELGRDDEELRVLAVGGSTTECLYHDDSKVWVRRVGEILGEGRDQRVWSGGAGRSGANTGDHVLQVKHLLAELPRVDVVLVLAGVNDVNVALAMPESYAPTPADLDPATHEKAVRKAFMQVPGTLEDSWDYDASFFRRSQLFQLVKRIQRKRSRDLGTLHLVDDDTGKGLVRWRDNRRQATRIRAELPDLGAALATFRTNLNTIADLAAAHGARLVFLTQPTLWREDLSEEDQKLLWMGGVGDYQREPGHEYYSPGALAEAMRTFNEATLAVCRERGLACVDLASEIPRTSKIFYDDCHFGHTGSELIAQAIAARLKTEAPFADR